MKESARSRQASPRRAMLRPETETRDRPAVHTSRCGDLTVRGTAEQISQRYAALADQAAKDRDEVLTETYRQQADHWGRVNNDL